MKAILKSLDTYKKDLKLSTHNSETRGCFNLLLIISFLVLNMTYIIFNISQPKLKRIEDKGYINTELINSKEMKFEMSIKVIEYFSYKTKQDLHMCDLYMHFALAKELREIKFKVINEEDSSSIIMRNSEVLFTITGEDFNSFSYISIRKQCKEDSDSEFLDSNFRTYINFEYINNGMLINSFNLDDDNSKKFLFEKSKYDSIIVFSVQKSEYKYEHLNMRLSLNNLYNDYKGLYDFNSEISSKLKNKIKNKEKLDIDIAMQDYIFSTDSISQIRKIDTKKHILLRIDFFLNKMAILYIRNYFHFLYYIPMLFSIFISVMKGLDVFNNIISYHYRYFYFLNNNCIISYNISKRLNSINDYSTFTGNNTYNAQDNFNNEINNKNLNPIESFTKYSEIRNTSSFDNNKLLFDGEVSKDDSNHKDEDSDKNLYYTLDNNDVKYTKKDAILFFIPFKCCRNNKTNIKLEILKDVKHKLISDKYSFCYLTNSVTTYLIHNNIINLLGKQGLLKPIFEYDLNKFNKDK